MHETDRIVVVGAGFGLWQNDRHVASGRWSDIVEVRALRSHGPDQQMVSVVLKLRDGPDVSFGDELSGYQSFLVAAESALPRMRPHAEWVMADEQPPGSGEVLLFTR